MSKYIYIFFFILPTPNTWILYYITENIAHLAETALHFLELVQENNLSSEQDLNGEDTEETLHPNENYDSGKCLPFNKMALLW